MFWASARCSSGLILENEGMAVRTSRTCGRTASSVCGVVHRACAYGVVIRTAPPFKVSVWRALEPTSMTAFDSTVWSTPAFRDCEPTARHSDLPAWNSPGLRQSCLELLSYRG